MHTQALVHNEIKTYSMVFGKLCIHGLLHKLRNGVKLTLDLMAEREPQA